MSDIVKVRGRHGTKSLDITIPAKISKEFDIHVGDVFKVDIVKENNSIKLIYELVYKD